MKVAKAGFDAAATRFLVFQGPAASGTDSALKALEALSSTRQSRKEALEKSFPPVTAPATARQATDEEISAFKKEVDALRVPLTALNTVLTRTTTNVGELKKTV